MIPYHQFKTLGVYYGINVPVWGTMLLIGLIFAVLTGYLEAKRQKLDVKIWFNTILLMGIFGIIGMRLYHFFIVRPTTVCVNTLKELIKPKSGVDSAGGVLGIVAMMYYLIKEKVNIGKYLDTFALSLSVVTMITRIGCHFAGCELGTLTAVPWAILRNGSLRHPIALYYVFSAMAIFLVLYHISRNQKYNLYDGFLFNLFCVLYPLSRVVLDIFRAEPKHIYLGMSIHQIAHLVIAVLAIVMMVYLLMSNKLKPAVRRTRKAVKKSNKLKPIRKINKR